jgi:predicted ribosome quality control (RQC) complex YloA/Tae2 family protein
MTVILLFFAVNMKTFSFQGFTIVAGQSARENDILTMTASCSDLWFHAEDVPGSHVLIRNSENATEDVIQYAAKLAVKLSKSPIGNSSVIYTDVSNVEKRKHAKPGEVVVNTFKRIVVRN